jgi:hypothetical protein
MVYFPIQDGSVYAYVDDIVGIEVSKVGNRVVLVLKHNVRITLTCTQETALKTVELAKYHARAPA